MTSLLYLMDDVERCKIPAAVTTTLAAVAVVLLYGASVGALPVLTSPELETEKQVFDEESVVRI